MEKNNDKPNHPKPILGIEFLGPSDSEEEIDKEIIEELTRAHPTNTERDVDEMIASGFGSSSSQTHAEVVKQSEMIVSTSKKHHGAIAKENVVPATMTERDVDEMIASGFGSSSSQTHAEVVKQSEMIVSTSKKHHGAIAKENVVPATMTERDVDEMIASGFGSSSSQTHAEVVKQSEMIVSTSKKHHGSIAKENVVPATMTERDIDEMIASGFGSSSSQTHAEVVKQSEMIVSTSKKHHGAIAKENVVPATTTESTAESPKRLRQEMLSDDELADMEVSLITGTLESRYRPTKRTTTSRQPAAATFIPIQLPLVKLPDISTFNWPLHRSVPRPRDTDQPPFPPGIYEVPMMKFPPLREMQFPPESSDYLPVNGSGKRKTTRGANKPYVDNDRDSSPFSSPEQRLPQYWQVDSAHNKEDDLERIVKSFQFVEKEEAADPKDQPGPSKSTSSNSKDSPSKDPKNKKAP